MSMLLKPTATFAITLRLGAASTTERSTASVNRLMSASLSAIRARSSSAGIAPSPVYRSISAAASSFDRTAEGSRRVMRIFGIGSSRRAGDRLMSQRYAIAAVIAAHRRLDETDALVLVAAPHERQHRVAGVHSDRPRLGRGLRGRPAGADLTRDRFANHLAQLAVIH